MDEMTVQEAEAYLHQPQDTTGGEVWSAATQRAARTTMGALWQMVIEEEREEADRRGAEPVLTQNPWRRAKVPERRQTRVVFLTPEEWRDLDRAVTGTPYRLLVGLAYLAGLRQSEIRHLRRDVDVILDDDPRIFVQSRKGKHPWWPKTERGQREVPVTGTLIEIVQEHIRLGFSGDRYLLRSYERDQPISAQTSIRWTEEAYEKAGIKYGRDGDGLTLHTGRHTYASWLTQAGVPPNVVAELLGDTVEVVINTYIHLAPKDHRKAVAEIEKLARGDG
jgi:integrase